MVMIFRLVNSKLPSWLKWNYTNNSHILNQTRTRDLSYQSIIEYLHALAKIYFNSNKEKKTQLLSDASQMTGLHRKSLIRTLNNTRPIKNYKKTNCGTKTKYPKELLLPHIKFLWISMEKISPKRMKAALSEWLPLYHENGIDQHTKFLLQSMSASTIARFVKMIKVVEKDSMKGLCSTSPSRYMKNKVPINTLDSKVTKPGFVQADTVAHCGTTLIGSFVYSITLTDIFSTWTENVAILNKRSDEVKDALGDVEKRLPFELIGINTDSGSEFLNTPVYNLYRNRQRKVIFTRSRPYKKNDNCYVEQKNFTHVRELFGYQRFEQYELTHVMNDIYTNYWNPLQNFFLPTFKIKEKVRIGGKIKKVYDDPITPYQRLMASGYLNEDQKRRLYDMKKAFNPFELKRGLEQKLSDFFKQVEEYNRTKEQKRRFPQKTRKLAI